VAYDAVVAEICLQHADELLPLHQEPEPRPCVIGFPALLLAWQWLRARRNPTRFEATGPIGTAINMVIFLALFLTPWYAQAFSFTSDAALVFYGASMWLRRSGATVDAKCWPFSTGFSAGRTRLAASC
jgi:hypothetical protein